MNLTTESEGTKKIVKAKSGGRFAIPFNFFMILIV